MRKSSAKLTFDNCFRWMEWDRDFLEKVYAAEKVVGKADEKKELFEAFVFKVQANREIFVQDLLVDCLNRDAPRYSDYMNARLPKHLSRNLCRAIISGLNYVDFRSVSDIKGTARKILVDKHNPFEKIPKDVSKKVDEFYTIRNYLAHYSDRAERSLLDMYKNKYRMKTFRAPGDFLFSRDKESGLSRFGNYVQAFIDAAKEMARFLGIWNDPK